MGNSFKDKVKKKLKNKIKSQLKNHYFNIQQNEDSLIFELKNFNIPFSKKYLIIKHRKNGKRISKELINSKTTVTFEDICQIDEMGIYDIHLNVEVKGRFFVKRSPFNFENNKDVFMFDEDNNLLFSSYPTQFSNLSFEFKEAIFRPYLDELIVDDNNITIKGNIDLFKDIEFDKVEFLAKSNKIGRIASICSYNQDSNKIHFTTSFETDFTEEDMFSVWSMFIRLIDKDIIVFQDKLRCDDLISKLHDEKTFQEIKTTIDDEEALLIFYPSKNLNTLFKIVTPESHLKSQQLLKDKKLYNKFKKDGLNSKYVFFESFHGLYNNNPKYLYEKMLNLGFNDEYQFIWAYDGDEKLPGNPIIVESGSEEYFKYLAQSKYRINNTTFPVIDNRRGIVFIQTWHGTPLKRLAHDIKVKQGVGWGHFNSEVGTWKYLISANEYSTNIFKRAFRFNKEILEFGYPANDIFYLADETKQKIKSKFNVPSDKKIILYAPTFRDDKRDDEGNRFFDLELDLEKLSQKLSDEYFLIIKTHYVISENLNISDKLKDFVIDLSMHDDIHELFILSDILITDYSSSFFDFAHSKKPILFFMPDLKSYMTTRGLYGEVIEELPGPIVKNNEEVIDALTNLDKVIEEYEQKYLAFYDKFCFKGRGNASEEIINHVWGDKLE